LTVLLDRLIQRSEDDTKLWISAYDYAKEVYPKKSMEELRVIADELVKKLERAH
jgi:hypothetical protein